MIFLDGGAQDINRGGQLQIQREGFLDGCGGRLGDSSPPYLRETVILLHS